MSHTANKATFIETIRLQVEADGPNPPNFDAAYIAAETFDYYYSLLQEGWPDTQARKTVEDACYFCYFGLKIDIAAAEKSLKADG
jgi:hypothetical protein